MIYIKFANQTYGEKAVSLLRRNGFRARLRKNPNPNRKEGCNYAVFVDGNADEAYALIDANGIKNLGVERYGGQF
ncbi:MAG: hypothetical protein NC122_01795 [Faecalibacterium sp.]|nr:hypothetical protein [Ruminococcus sp.]MCM1391622.1 hypothetical protein [Ruminococcus sp.]MCM1484916.1 hypothetical protein [Faecalibacterium sp.]